MASYGIPIRVRWRAVSTEPVPSSAAADRITARPRHGDAEVAVVATMKANRFFAGGLGYWDYYSGYGLMAAAVRIVEACCVSRSRPLRRRSHCSCDRC